MLLMGSGKDKYWIAKLGNHQPGPIIETKGASIPWNVAILTDRKIKIL